MQAKLAAIVAFLGTTKLAIIITLWLQSIKSSNIDKGWLQYSMYVVRDLVFHAFVHA